MKKCVVLWTDQKQAIIVSITDGTEEILHVESKVEGAVQKKWKHRPGEYYRKVIRAIQDAREIFVFGPAQAKMALKEELLKSELPSHRIVGTETADTMTENELVARAREIWTSGDSHPLLQRNNR